MNLCKITRRNAIKTMAMATAAPLLNVPSILAQDSNSSQLQQSISDLEQIIDAHTAGHKEEQGLIDEAVDKTLGKDAFKYVRRFIYDPDGGLVKQIYQMIYGKPLEGHLLEKLERVSAITLPIQTESGIKSYVFFKQSALPGTFDNRSEREIAYPKFLGKIAHENAHAAIYNGRLKVQGGNASSLLNVDPEVADFLQEVQCKNEELMFLTRYWIRQEAFDSAAASFNQYAQSESERILARTNITESDRKKLERQKAMATIYIDRAISIRNSYGRN